MGLFKKKVRKSEKIAEEKKDIKVEDKVFERCPKSEDKVLEEYPKLDYLELTKRIDDYELTDTQKEIYENVLKDEELENNSRLRMEKSAATIRLWQRVCQKYNVQDDKLFFIYAMYLYLTGQNPGYGLCFLYGESTTLRNDMELNKLLEDMAKRAVIEFTEMRELLKEEYIKYSKDTDVCPMHRGQVDCRRYDNCTECMEDNLGDEELYTCLYHHLKLTNVYFPHID